MHVLEDDDVAESLRDDVFESLRNDAMELTDISQRRLSSHARLLVHPARSHVTLALFI